MKNKEIIITKHACLRAKERLDLKEEYGSLLFEAKIKEIFAKARCFEVTDSGKKIYEAVYNSRIVKFICNENNNKIIVNTIMIKK